MILNNIFNNIFQKGVDHMKDINRAIACAIVQAQLASDAGKGIYELSVKSHTKRSAEHFKYGIKTFYILTAVRLIRCNKSDFNYFISAIEGDQNGCPSILVYFDFKVNGKRQQVSFHTPLNQVPEEMKRISPSGRKTRWMKSVSSRDACKLLIEEYKLGD